jgi:hypothetical protein
MNATSPAMKAGPREILARIGPAYRTCGGSVALVAEPSVPLSWAHERS